MTEPEPLAPASLRAEVVEETRQLADRLDTEGPAALGHYRVTRFIPRPDGTADRVVTEPACELTASLKSGLAVRARLLAEMADLKPQLARTAARVEAHREVEQRFRRDHPRWVALSVLAAAGRPFKPDAPPPIVADALDDLDAYGRLAARLRTLAVPPQPALYPD